MGWLFLDPVLQDLFEAKGVEARIVGEASVLEKMDEDMFPDGFHGNGYDGAVLVGRRCVGFVGGFFEGVGEGLLEFKGELVFEDVFGDLAQVQYHLVNAEQGAGVLHFIESIFEDLAQAQGEEATEAVLHFVGFFFVAEFEINGKPVDIVLAAEKRFHDFLGLNGEVWMGWVGVKRKRGWGSPSCNRILTHTP